MQDDGSLIGGEVEMRAGEIERTAGDALAQLGENRRATRSGRGDGAREMAVRLAAGARCAATEGEQSKDHEAPRHGAAPLGNARSRSARNGRSMPRQVSHDTPSTATVTSPTPPTRPNRATAGASQNASSGACTR